jgi:hypothetical protein
MSGNFSQPEKRLKTYWVFWMTTEGGEEGDGAWYWSETRDFKRVGEPRGPFERAIDAGRDRAGAGGAGMTWVYVLSERDTDEGWPVYTVGFYDPRGEWHSDSDHAGERGRKDAAARVNYLNGGSVSFSFDP